MSTVKDSMYRFPLVCVSMCGALRREWVYYTANVTRNTVNAYKNKCWKENGHNVHDHFMYKLVNLSKHTVDSDETNDIRVAVNTYIY